MSALSEFLERSCRKPHWLLTGRATTALYLWLHGEPGGGRQVVLPVNVCYSLVHAVTLSGHRPRFVDVDPQDGNVRQRAVAATLDAETAAVVVVHNLGNPCRDLPAIVRACRAREIPVVEDCAAAVGGSLDARPLGSFSDYALFSFGRGKTVDAGLGGLLASTRSLQRAERANEELPLWSPRLAEKSELFSRLYGLVYHSSFYDELLGRMAPMRGFFEDIYRFRLSPEQAARVESAFARLPDRIAERQAVRAEYDAGLPFGHFFRRYPLPSEAVPWRYTLLVDAPQLRRRCIDALLQANMRVSAWYPPIHALFGDDGHYPLARQFAGRVLNLPLDEGLDEARRITAVLRELVPDAPDVADAPNEPPDADRLGRENS